MDDSGPEGDTPPRASSRSSSLARSYLALGTEVFCMDRGHIPAPSPRPSSRQASLGHSVRSRPGSSCASVVPSAMELDLGIDLANSTRTRRRGTPSVTDSSLGIDQSVLGNGIRKRSKPLRYGAGLGRWPHSQSDQTRTCVGRGEKDETHEGVAFLLASVGLCCVNLGRTVENSGHHVSTFEGTLLTALRRLFA